MASVGLTAVVADAAIIGATQLRYEMQARDVHGNMVQATVADLYLISDDPNDIALNIYDVDMTNSLGATDYYQAASGETWNPMFTDPNYGSAWMQLDSFVSIGGINTSTAAPSQDLVTTSLVDPSFGGSTAPEPAQGAGWYTNSPLSATGRVGESVVGLGVFIGRFSLEGAGDFALEGHLKVTWNQGEGTGWNQERFDIDEGQFVVVPGAGGSLALLLAAGVRRQRRR